MKLIKCYVRNFGTLRDFSLDFSNGLTVIKEDNGFGKSTLAAFLKVMLYGLPQTTKRSIDENDRKKYKPWQGGDFGGSLTFEVNGKQYRVDRSFGAKEKDDTFRLVDLTSGAESDDFSSNLGVELFGVDAESFERSVFVPQVDTATEMNNTIRAKLTGLIENSDDISNYDNAVKVLEKRAKFYSVANGARGDIADKTREIESLQASLTDKSAAVGNLNDIKAELIGLKASATELTTKMDELRKRITVVSDAAALLEQKRQRDELSATLESTRQNVDKIKSLYPNGFPTEEDILGTEKQLGAVKSAETELGLLQSNAADQSELEKLKDYFKNGVPTEQEVYDTRKNVSAISQLEIKAESLKSRLADAPQTTHKSSNAAVKVCLVLAVVIAVLGSVAFLWQAVAGIVLLCVAFLGLGVSGFMYLKNMITANNTPKIDAVGLKNEYDTTCSEIDRLTAEIQGFCDRFDPDYEPSQVVENVVIAMRDYARLEAAVKRVDAEVEKRRLDVSVGYDKLNAFFNRYCANATLEYNELLNKIKGDMLEVTRLENEIKTLSKKLSEMPEVQGNADLDEGADRQQLLDEEKRLLQELDLINNRITSREVESARLLAETQMLPELEERLENLKIERDEAVERYNVITATLDLLQKAKQDLSLRYLDRVTEGFKKYSAMLGVDSDDALIDTDLNVELSECGTTREKEYFSCGLRDMIDIAMRLGLCDALFEDEEAVLILDDPFVNLDDARLKNAMELLNKVSETRQIVYLTCHSSRC